MFATETIHAPTVLRLLRGIDGLPAGAAGALVLTSKNGSKGMILVEDGRVCWAAAADMENRLTELLRAQGGAAAAPPEAFEEVFVECHRKERPLGETLVRRGLVSRDGLKSALREHSAEAIARLSTVPRLVLGWRPSRTKKYDAQFTFASIELLCSVGALGFEEMGVEAERKLMEVTPGGSVGVAFRADALHSLPLAQISAGGWHCQSLVELGDWARRALNEQGPNETGSVLGSDTVRSLKRAWRAGDLILVRWTGDVQPEPLAPTEPIDLERETLLAR